MNDKFLYHYILCNGTDYKSIGKTIKDMECKNQIQILSISTPDCLGVCYDVSNSILYACFFPKIFLNVTTKLTISL